MNTSGEVLAGIALGLIFTVLLAIGSIPVALAFLLWKAVFS